MAFAKMGVDLEIFLENRACVEYQKKYFCAF